MHESTKIMNELIQSVLEWWDEHRFDCTGDGIDERNVYDDEPDFVKKANQLKELMK